MITELGTELLSGLAYGIAGIVLLGIGYAMFDIVTPGDLRKLIYEERNRNAALVASSGLIALAMIIAVAIVAAHDDFARGLASATGYGLLGVLLLGVSFIVIDKVTPGDLGVICTDREPHPAVYVTVASQLALGAILAAAIS